MSGKGTAIACGVLFTYGLAASAANAQQSADTAGDQLADIVVTAQKREQNLQKVPLAVTAIGGDTLQDRGITNLTDLGATIPGLQIQSNSGVVLPFLRG